MTPFTDEELRVAKRRAYHLPLSAQVKDFDNEQMLALIARLEAAEKYIETSNVPNCNCDGECDVHLPLRKKWQKAKGEE